MVDREVRIVQDAPCPHCTGSHRVEVLAAVTVGKVVFRGGAAREVRVEAHCLVTGDPFDVLVDVPLAPGQRVGDARVVDSADSQPPSSAESRRRWEERIDVWRQESPAIGRDIAGKLLGAGTAAVAAYLALLRYVGGESLIGWRLAVGVVPAVGYLAVTVLAAVALRPLRARLHDEAEAEAFLDRVLSWQSQLLSASVVTFVCSTVLATAALLLVWR